MFSTIQNFVNWITGWFSSENKKTKYFDPDCVLEVFPEEEFDYNKF